jgi:hypothetical protein
MISSGIVAVGGTATLIHTAAGATKIRVQAGSTTAIQLGASGVTFGNGFPLAQSSTGIPESLELTLSDGDGLYGISAGSSVNVSFIATT